MKTAVSIPDEIYKEADRTARRMRVSRSALYAKALQFFLETHRDEGVTEALDALYSKEGSGLDSALAPMQFGSLPKEDW